MTKAIACVCALVVASFAASRQAARPSSTPSAYSAHQDGDVVRLEDASAHAAVSILTSVGNIAFEMTVNGRNVLHWPYASIAAFKARPAMSGIPFVGPWANRLDEQAFYANGKRYAFDMSLGNVKGEIPIHGFLTTTDHWRLIAARSDADSAWATSRLDVFEQPAWMKQWPFAHTIDMTYRLSNGTLEVETTITNMSAEPMPVSVGFHPYFQLTDSPRSEWTISVGARTHLKLTPNKLPTGETEPLSAPYAGGVPLRDYDIDDGFADLVRDAQGRATMSVMGKAQRLDVLFGPNYRAAVVWSLKPHSFICFEPMTGITNAMNMAQKGTYKELQYVAPGGTWQESWSVKAVGF